MNNKEWKFDFVVADLSEQLANELIDHIVNWVEANKTIVGGGFGPIEEVLSDEQTSQVRTTSYHHRVVKGPTGNHVVIPVENEEIPDGKENTG